MSDNFPVQNFTLYEAFEVLGEAGIFILQSIQNPSSRLQFDNTTLPDRYTQGGLAVWNNISINFGYCDWVGSFGAPNNNLPSDSQINAYLRTKFIAGPCCNSGSMGIESVLPSAGPGESLVNTTDSTSTIIYLKNLIAGQDTELNSNTSTITINALGVSIIDGAVPKTSNPDIYEISKLSNADGTATMSLLGPGNASLHTTGNFSQQIDVDSIETITGDKSISCDGVVNITASGTSSIQSENGLQISAGSSDLQLFAGQVFQINLGTDELQILNLQEESSALNSLLKYNSLTKEVRYQTTGPEARCGVNPVSDQDPTIGGLFLTASDTWLGDWTMPLTTSSAGLGGADNFIYNPNSEITVNSNSITFNKADTKYNVSFELFFLGPTTTNTYAIAQILPTGTALFTGSPVCASVGTFFPTANFPNAPSGTYGSIACLKGNGILSVTTTPVSYSLAVEISDNNGSGGGSTFKPTIALTSNFSVEKIIQ